jgi:hypothetical protein
VPGSVGKASVGTFSLAHMIALCTVPSHHGTDMFQAQTGPLYLLSTLQAVLVTFWVPLHATSTGHICKRADELLRSFAKHIY